MEGGGLQDFFEVEGVLLSMGVKTMRDKKIEKRKQLLDFSSSNEKINLEIIEWTKVRDLLN